MPDPPDPRRKYQALQQPGAADGARPAVAKPGYVELHAKTNFSFLEGASHPDELVVQAAALGYAALAITDRHSLAGVVRAHVAAKDVGLPLVIGAEVHPIDAPSAVLWVSDRAAYGRLSRLLTRGRRRSPKGECRLTFGDLAEHAEGLLAGVFFSAGQAAPGGFDERLRRSLHAYRELFGGRGCLLAEVHHGPDDARRLAELAELARQVRLPLAAAGDVHYHVPGRQALSDVLCAVRHRQTVREAAGSLFANAQRHLLAPAEIAVRFAAVPEALAHGRRIAAACRFSLDELRYEYPEELCPPGLAPLEHLARLTWQGARQRYPAGIPDKVRRLLEHELQLIEQLHYEAYFLTVWDLVRFARSRGILCQGRGSAANSAVCFALGITSVDPEQIDVLFERFVSAERNEAPDIDVDFEHERREEVLQYLYEKYGRERAGLTAEVITYRPRSAVRDVGKALGLSPDRVDRLAKALDSRGPEIRLSDRCREAGLDPASPLAGELLRLVAELVGFPRHLSQHVGGMVITRGPLSELVPIENAAMPGRTVIQWDKDDLDALGILKVDCLALGMLTAIRKCFALVAAHGGPRLTLAAVPAEDPAVYEMIGRADTMGVFQIESRAQMSMLPRLRPRSFYDLVIEVAIVRPGPIQGNMVHPYLRRRAGLEPVDFPNDAIRAVLEKTLGVPIFQEQAMRLAVVAAGFTPGEADQLRRAMGAWRRSGVIEKFRRKLIDGMLARGLDEQFAERVFQQIRGFGEYGFPESHAASFARLVYVSAWLKRYHPAAFAAALLNSQPMGFYAPAQLVHDARQHGVEIRPLDVNRSHWDATLEPADEALPAAPAGQAPPAADPAARRAGSNRPALRLGLRLILGLPQADAQRIVDARQAGPLRSLDELARRARLGKSALLRLARADAFGSLGLDRRGALWLALSQQAKPLPLLDGLECDEPSVSLPRLSLGQQVVADYRTITLSLRAHPLALLRDQLDKLRVTPAAELARAPSGSRVRVAGLVLLRQRPGTASGITFVTLEDETGTANLIVRPAVWERFHHVARGAHALLAGGRLQRQGRVIHVLVERMDDLSGQLAGVAARSRDFR